MRLGSGFGGGPTPNYEAQDATLARKYLAEGKDRSIARLGQAIRAFEDAVEDQEGTPSGIISVGRAADAAVTAHKVFVVHGHDEAALQTMARFLEKLELEAIVCGSAWKKDPVSGLIGVEQGPLIPMV